MNTDFIRIKTDKLDLLRWQVELSTDLNNAAKDRITKFIHELKLKGNYNNDQFITRGELDKFFEGNNSYLDFANGKNAWVLDKYFDEFGEVSENAPYQDYDTQSTNNMSNIKIINYNGEVVTAELNEVQRNKLKEITDFGLKLYISSDLIKQSKDVNKKLSNLLIENIRINLNTNINTEIELAYSRMQSLKESRRTGTPLTMVYDLYAQVIGNNSNYWLPHGIVVSYQVSKLGGVPLRYNDSGARLSEYIEEIQSLRSQGFQINTLNLSIGPMKDVSIKKLKKQMLSEINREASFYQQVRNIKDNGSNLNMYRKFISKYLFEEQGLKKLNNGSYADERFSRYLDIYNSITKFENMGVNVINSSGNSGFDKDGSTYFNPYNLPRVQQNSVGN